MAGIEETQDVIDFITELAEAIEGAREDGELDIFDAVRFLKVAPSVASLMKGADEIKAELADLTAEEKDELIVGLKESVLKLIGALT
jgi:hypothetical protein